MFGEAAPYITAGRPAGSAFRRSIVGKKKTKLQKEKFQPEAIAKKELNLNRDMLEMCQKTRLN